MSASPPPWNELVRVADPGLGQAITLLHPVLTINFYLRLIDYAAIRQLYDEAMKLIEPELTHYIAETMKRPAKITPRALGMIPAWMHKPKEDRSYSWNGYGGADLGCGPPGLELFLWASPVPPPDKKQRMVQAAIKNFGGEGEISGYMIRSSIRLMLPVDHALADASTLSSWLLSLAVLRSGNFDSVECSYGLSSWTHLDRETWAEEKAACSRYPGLDCFRPSHAGQLRADASYPDLIPLVKRAAWTNVLHELTVRALGGEAKVKEQLASVPEIRVTPFEHGLILQAGEHPALGDLNRGDSLPLLRKVAAVIRPVRVTKLVERESENDEFWGHFFNIFDKSYT